MPKEPETVPLQITDSKLCITRLGRLNSMIISMALCEIVVTPVRNQWSYCSLALSHRYTRLLFVVICCGWVVTNSHYSDVIMGAITSQMTSLTIVYSTVHSGVDKRKHQSSASLAFVWIIHRWPVNSRHKWPVTRKCCHLMTSSCTKYSSEDYFVVTRAIIWLAITMTS